MNGLPRKTLSLLNPYTYFPEGTICTQEANSRTKNSQEEKIEISETSLNERKGEKTSLKTTRGMWAEKAHRANAEKGLEGKRVEADSMLQIMEKRFKSTRKLFSNLQKRNEEKGVIFDACSEEEAEGFHKLARPSILWLLQLEQFSHAEKIANADLLIKTLFQLTKTLAVTDLVSCKEPIFTGIKEVDIKKIFSILNEFYNPPAEVYKDNLGMKQWMHRQENSIEKFFPELRNEIQKNPEMFPQLFYYFFVRDLTRSNEMSKKHTPLIDEISQHIRDKCLNLKNIVLLKRFTV